MRRVTVRFTGAVDATVRRRAVAEGRKLRKGTRKQFVLLGFVVTIVAYEAHSVATVVELGLQALALWGVALSQEQRGGQLSTFRIPSSARLKSGGGRYPPSVATPVGEEQLTGFRLSTWANPLAELRAWQASSVRHGVSDDQAARLGLRLSGKVELHPQGVTHCVGGGLGLRGVGVGDLSPAGQWLRTTPWLATSRFLSGYLTFMHWGVDGYFGAHVSDDWLYARTGVNRVFVGGGRREDVVENKTAGRPWYQIGVTPEPRLGLADDGGTFSNKNKYAWTRESPLAYRQSCNPGFAVVAGSALVAAPTMVLEDSMFLLNLREPGGAEGFASTRSLTWAFSEPGASLIAAAGRPEIALMRFVPAPVTELEVERAGDSSADAPEGRYVRRVRSVQGVAFSDGAAEVGDSYLAWGGVSAVGFDDLPMWYRPGTLRDYSLALRDSWVWDGVGTGAAVFPEVLSDQLQPSAFGAVYATEVDGVIEFACGLKALDSAIVPVGASRRVDADGVTGAPTQASVVVAKVGIAFVTTDIAATSVAVAAAFPDVIGPADCEQYQAGMNPAFAVLPQVRFACVLGTKRTYAVRAVRYERNPFLASALSMTGVGTPLPYTGSYAGRRAGSVGGPIFYVDREFGPYPDRTQYEELWFVIDRTKYVVNVKALGGSIEPVTEGKYTNTLLPVFAYDSPAAPGSVFSRQLLGMFSDTDEDDYELLDYYADEFAAAGMEMNTFAQVSDTDIMFVLHRRGAINKYDTDALVCRFSSVTGTAAVVSAVVSRRPNFMALTCYQHEVVVDGEVVQQACLILRVGRYDRLGDVYTSVDAGATWELLYDQDSTKRLDAGGTATYQDGTPSLGLHIGPRIGGGRADPRYTLRSPPKE